MCGGYDTCGISRSLKGKSSSPWVETKEDFCSESNMNRIIDYIKSALYKYEKMDKLFWCRNPKTNCFEPTDLYKKYWNTDRHVHTRNGMEMLYHSFVKLNRIPEHILKRIRNICERNVIVNLIL